MSLGHPICRTQPAAVEAERLRGKVAQCMPLMQKHLKLETLERFNVALSGKTILLDTEASSGANSMLGANNSNVVTLMGRSAEPRMISLDLECSPDGKEGHPPLLRTQMYLKWRFFDGEALYKGVGGETSDSFIYEAADTTSFRRNSAPLARNEAIAAAESFPAPGVVTLPILPGVNSPEDLLALPEPNSIALCEAVARSVDRLLVSDYRNGSRKVRFEVSDEVFPGVTVDVQEAQGRLQVNFICNIENSRLRLVRGMYEIASMLAQRLCRSVLVRIVSCNEHDSCLDEALGGI